MIVKNEVVKFLLDRATRNTVTTMVATLENETPQSYLLVVHADDADKVSDALRGAGLRVAVAEVTQADFSED